MHLHIDSECLGHVCDLHRARNPHVVFRIEVNVIAAAAEQEPSLLLKPADVFGDQQRRLKMLAEHLMAKSRN